MSEGEAHPVPSAPRRALTPAVLERSVLAATLLLPGAGLLASVGFEGQAGRLTVGVVVIAAVIYASVAWLIGGRRQLAAELATATPLPDDVDVVPESLGLTAARAGLRALAVLVVTALTSLLHLLALGAALALGVGLLAALMGLGLARAERSAPGRLMRESGGPVWAPAGALRRY